MAQTKPEVNRSQVIRDFVTKNPAMLISEVVTKLGEQGVKVSKNLVYMVKMKMKAKKAKEKKKAKAAAKETQPASAPSSNGSAKASSKSAAVRAVLKGNRKLTAKDVVSALAEKGTSVTEGLVYFVKGQMKGKRSQKKAQKEVAQVVTVTALTPALANGDALKTILKVKAFAAEVGGMKRLIALAQALSE